MDADGPYCTWPRVSRYVHIVYPMAGAWVQDKDGVRQLSREELRPLNEVMKRHLERSMEGDFTTDALRYAPKCVNGHPYCNRCVMPVDLSEDSIEQMCREIEATLSNTGKPIAITPTHAYVRMHRWKPDTYICEDCGATEEAIEDGVAPRFCPENR